MLREGELQAAEAIERMERLRFIWRGGPFEFTVLHRLGQLYLADGRPREGLTVLRQAVANFPDHREAQAITGEMADAFRDLYLDDGAPKVSPLVAVALYDEFRELTPAGAEGDRLIAGLADRLVEVDLLEPDPLSAARPGAGGSRRAPRGDPPARSAPGRRARRAAVELGPRPAGAPDPAPQPSSGARSL